MVYSSGRTATANGKVAPGGSHNGYGEEFNLDEALKKGATVESTTKVSDTLTLIIIEEGDKK